MGMVASHFMMTKLIEKAKEGMIGLTGANARPSIAPTFVVDPDAFMGQETFKKTAGDICRALRASQKAPGYDRIYTAGEKEYLTWLDRKDKGVPIGKAVQEELITLRDKLKLDYKFSFEG